MQKNKVGALTLPNFNNTQLKLHYSRQCDIGERTDRLMENKMSPEISPQKYGQVISDIGANTIQWRKNSLFNK